MLGVPPVVFVMWCGWFFSFVESDMGEVPFDGGKPIEGKPSDTMDYFEKLATA